MALPPRSPISLATPWGGIELDVAEGHQRALRREGEPRRAPDAEGAPVMAVNPVPASAYAYLLPDQVSLRTRARIDPVEEETSRCGR